jgi:TPR repeat protein
VLHDHSKQGDANAQCALGACYANGDGVDVDMDRAARLYGRAAKQGFAAARYNLGTCYANGKGVKLDKAKAARLLG